MASNPGGSKCYARALVNLGLPVSKIVKGYKTSREDREYIVGTEGDHQLLVGLDHKRKGLTVAVGLGRGA
jgi:hypothetical protein